MGQRIKEEKPKKIIPAGYTELRTGEMLATAEYTDRCNAWDLYYPEVLKTRAYQRYVEMKDAVNKNDRAKIEFLKLEGKQALESGKRELTVPPWPDPRIIRRSKYNGEILTNLTYDKEEREYQEIAEPYTLIDND